MLNENRLQELGIKQTGHFVLSSGIKTTTFYEVSRLFQYSPEIIQEVLQEFIETLKALTKEINIDQLIGIPTGGHQLAQFLSIHLNIPVYSWEESRPKAKSALLIDDVLTTGETIKKIIPHISNLSHIAVLINRSREGGKGEHIKDLPSPKGRPIPITSGLYL